jgi:hypothetical protein
VSAPYGVPSDSDQAIFPAVDVSTSIGSERKIQMTVPYFTGALGSTDIARIHWESMAVAAAIAGTLVVVGENVCGMDPNAEFRNSHVARSPEMERRVKIFQQWYNGSGGSWSIQRRGWPSGRPEYVVENIGR